MNKEDIPPIGTKIKLTLHDILGDPYEVEGKIANRITTAIIVKVVVDGFFTVQKVIHLAIRFTLLQKGSVER